MGFATSDDAAVFTCGNCDADAHTAASPELPPLRDRERMRRGKKMQAQTERSVHTGRAREEREREQERAREREGGMEREGEERKRLHLLAAPALGSLPTSVSREGSE